MNDAEVELREARERLERAHEADRRAFAEKHGVLLASSANEPDPEELMRAGFEEHARRAREASDAGATRKEANRARREEAGDDVE